MARILLDQSTLVAPTALYDGDVLDVDTFLARYETLPDLRRVELIEGVVHMPSPIRYTYHGQQQADLGTALGVYRAETPGVLGAGGPTFRLDDANAVEPDLFLLLPQVFEPRWRLIPAGYFHGVPDLVIEVSASTRGVDLGPKRRAYERNGVQEYLVVLPIQEQLVPMRLESGRLVEWPVEPDGFLHSGVFPGLWLSTEAIINADLPGLLEGVRAGLASPAHAEFVARIRAAGG